MIFHVQISSRSVLVSAPDSGGRTVVMTTTPPQPVVTSVVATTTIIGPTLASVGPATMQLTAAPMLSLQAPVAMGHRAGVGIIHAPPLTAQVCQVSVELTNASTLLRAALSVHGQSPGLGTINGF